MFQCVCVDNIGHVVHSIMVGDALQAHRDGCMCIICKQARRVGKTWGGMSGMPGGPKWQGPMITGGGRQGQPVPRFGKRAFLHALPHLVCGPLQHKVVYLPSASCFAAFCHADTTGLQPCNVACPNMSALQRVRIIRIVTWFSGNVRSNAARKAQTAGSSKKSKSHKIYCKRVKRLASFLTKPDWYVIVRVMSVLRPVNLS